MAPRFRLLLTVAGRDSGSGVISLNRRGNWVRTSRGSTISRSGGSSIMFVGVECVVVMSIAKALNVPETSLKKCTKDIGEAIK
jgi:hypothetical protein